MTKRHVFAALALAGALLAGPSGAHEFQLGDLVINHPFSYATAAGARTGAGYLAVRNDGEVADRLIEVRADFPMVQIHVTEVDTAGVARMIEVEGIEIPPGATVTLEPGGAHVMFMGLDAALDEGAVIDATLVFERAGSIAVQFDVEARGADGHGNMHDNDAMKHH